MSEPDFRSTLKPSFDFLVDRFGFVASHQQALGERSGTDFGTTWGRRKLGLEGNWGRIYALHYAFGRLALY